MKRPTALLSVLTMAAMSLSIGCADSPSHSAPTPPIRAAAPATQQRLDEFKRAAQLNNLQGAELERFMTARSAWQAKIAARDESAEGKKLEAARIALSEAKKSKDEAKIKAAQEAYDPLAKANHEFRKKVRGELFGVLTLDQQRVWAADVLTGRVLKSLGRARLDEAQKEKVHALAKRAADQYVQKNTMQEDPYLEGFKDVAPKVVDEAKAKVLTAEQRQALEPKAPAAQPATKRS